MGARPMPIAKATISFGMVQVPVGIEKASAVDAPSLSSLCHCGGDLGYLADDEGNKVVCQDHPDDPDHRFSWWNQVPQKGFELGGETVPLTSDEIDAATAESPVETGNVEKVVPVKKVLLHYAVEGNYYLMPGDDFQDQYGALVGALNEHDLALLSYLVIGKKVRRYAVVSEGGVLLALQLQDKKAIPQLEYGVNETMEEQAASMLTAQVEDDPALPDVEGQGLKSLVREKVEADAEPDDEAIAQEV